MFVACMMRFDFVPTSAYSTGTNVDGDVVYDVQEKSEVLGIVYVKFVSNGHQLTRAGILNT